MTVREKVKELVYNGMKKTEVFEFFNNTNRDVLDYVAIFGQEGVKQNIIWDFYEEWQQIGN
jgi:hypothetical protein